jgi:hypothetical protein
MSVVTHILRKKYLIEATLRRDGSHVLLPDRDAVTNTGDSRGREEIHFHVTKNVVSLSPLPYETIDSKTSEIKLNGGLNNGDVTTIFLDNRYGFLPATGNIVIDVGAKMVFAIEPFPKNYEIARMNVEQNNFSDRINITLAGCSAKPGLITLDPNFRSNLRSTLAKFEGGIGVPLLTLENLLDKINH